MVKKGQAKAYGLRNVGGKTRRVILTTSHVIKVLGKFLVLDNTIPQKTEQIQTVFFKIIFCIKITQISMFTICLITNQMICEKNHLLCWTVPEKIKVLLAFS